MPDPVPAPGRRVRVLQSVQLGGPRPSYADHVAGHLDPGRFEVLSFSYRTALTGRWDVLHVHWPENLLRHRSPVRRVLRAVLFALVLLRIRWTRPVVVRTAHNIAPHEGDSAVERSLLAGLDRAVTWHVRLVDGTPLRPGAAAVTIPHGHYRAELGAPVPPADDRSLLFFGYLRPYKGVDALLAAFAAVPDTDVRLVVAGEPASAGMRTLVEEAAAADPRVTGRLGFAADDELAGLVRASSVVVLPYREIHNSGVVFAALSLGRPVLVPENAVTAALREEIGPDWVLGFSHPLTAEDLTGALAAAARRDPTVEPDLSGRGWAAVAHRYAEVFTSTPGRRR